MMNRHEDNTGQGKTESFIGRRSVVLIENPGEVPRLASRRRLNSVILPANDTCLNAIAQAVVSAPRKAGVLVIPWLPRGEIFPILLRGFHRVLPLSVSAFPNNIQRLRDGINAAEPARLLGAVPDAALAAVTLYRADLSSLCVAADWFTQGGENVITDISALRLEEDGTMVHLGSRRWPAHQVIAAFDSNFRRRLRRLELTQNDTLGGLVRRTRKERRLAREEFPGIDAKTIARIERNEITRPQRETLRLIAQTLGLPIEQLLGKIVPPETDSTSFPPAADQADEHSASA
jgi:transcriptional regulator with XRE-family HTH domain